MRKQVEANQIRMTVLEKENSALNETLHKWEIANLGNSSKHTLQTTSHESGYGHQSPESTASYNKVCLTLSMSHPICIVKKLLFFLVNSAVEKFRFNF